MAEHPALETRLRAALGAAADGAAPRAPRPGAPRPGAALPGAALTGGPPTDPDVARARVLSGIRHRRARRLRVAGGAVTAVVALGIALPLVLGGGPAPTGAHSPESSSALAPRQASASPAQGSLPPAAVPGAHARSTPASTGRCLAGTATLTPCGDLAAGVATGAATGQPDATSATPPEYRAAAPATRATVHVRAGRQFEITLPRLTGRRTWSTPRLLGTYHGQGTPLEVRRSPRTRVPRPGWQGFVVRTTVAGTFELEAYAQAPRTPGLPPTAGPLATWTLKVEVTGK